MPNHVRNVLKIKHIPPENKIAMIEKLTSTNYTKEEVFPLSRIIDFNKIIPEPRTKEECPADCFVTSTSHITADKDKPWFDWYSWRIQHWDTKWNAYDGYIKIDKSSITFVFSTAWSVPKAIYSELARLYPSLEMEVKWADEDLGSFCGKAVHIPGEPEWSITYAQDMDNSRAFAKRLWDNY